MSTFSKLRVGPKRASAGVAKLVGEISFDPTQTSAASGYILPKGAVITGITSLGGATGGTNPTVDIGISGGSAVIANEVDADTAGTAGTVEAAYLYVPLTADTEVYVGVGASAATGGTTTVAIEYYIQDPRGGANS